MLALRAARGFDGERAFDGAVTVLVDQGRIRGVEAGWPAVGSEWRVVEYPECSVLPGLVDLHVHLGGDGRDGALDRLADLSDDALESVIEDALRRHLAAGVTTVRDLGDRRYSVIEYRRRRGAGPSPTIVAAGPPLTTVGGHCWPMGGEIAGPEHVRAAVRERAERGADVVKVMTSGGTMTAGTDVMRCQFTLEDLRLIVREAHGLGLPVVAHAHGLPAVEQCVAAGVDGIEHFSCLTESGVEVSDGLLAQVAAARIAVDPTMGKAPGAVPPPAVRELMARLGLTWGARQGLMGRMHRAGVRLVTGTDAGISSGKAHGILSEAVGDYVAGGVSADAALAAATSGSAEACGLGARKGMLRPGYDADLLVVSGDPLEDISALKAPVAVYVAGEPAP